MEKIGAIDAWTKGRSPLPDAKREKLESQNALKQKEEGYEQLRELCRLGEYDLATQLANRFPDWGYRISDGIVVEQIEDL
ncbi:hypothetical protein IQ249_09785 [Lusitaniella coriacea LEGE 07157]|uniref:Uncharacterized protein n=1 Tax=Lusitaniella coriacea LEGE 07157 TaxID=945747 RepID=A0A8J7J8S1_9CYAN|nr:hypothetical protein [Lusitaniella coriacea]MBE9116185.1 hypothetical protein [Lusitaniella coriacea LEGE 07157]